MDGAVRFFQAGSRSGCGRPTRPIELTGGAYPTRGTDRQRSPWVEKSRVCALRGSRRRRRWYVWRGAALGPWVCFKSSFTYENTPGFSLCTKVISVGAADGFGRALTIAKLKCWCDQLRQNEHGRGARLVSELAGWLSCPPLSIYLVNGVAVGLLNRPAAFERAPRALYTAPALRYIPQRPSASFIQPSS